LLLDNTSIPVGNWYYNAEMCAYQTLYDQILLVESLFQTHGRCTEASKLIPARKKLQGFPLGIPIQYNQPVGCTILVHHAVAATVASH